MLVHSPIIRNPGTISSPTVYEPRLIPRSHLPSLPGLMRSVNAIQCELNHAKLCWPSSLCTTRLTRVGTSRERNVNTNRAASVLSMRNLVRVRDNRALVK